MSGSQNHFSSGLNSPHHCRSRGADTLKSQVTFSGHWIPHSR